MDNLLFNSRFINFAPAENAGANAESTEIKKGNEAEKELDELLGSGEPVSKEELNRFIDKQTKKTEKKGKEISEKERKRAAMVTKMVESAMERINKTSNKTVAYVMSGGKKPRGERIAEMENITGKTKENAAFDELVANAPKKDEAERKENAAFDEMIASAPEGKAKSREATAAKVARREAKEKQGERLARMASKAKRMYRETASLLTGADFDTGTSVDKIFGNNGAGKKMASRLEKAFDQYKEDPVRQLAVLQDVHRNVKVLMEEYTKDPYSKTVARQKRNLQRSVDNLPV